MDKTQLKSYVQDLKTQGKNKEQIYTDLLSKGTSVNDIEWAFGAIAFDDAKEDTSKKTIRLIVTIGAILVGAGIFSFIAANWQLMDRPLKVMVILVSMLLAYILGWYLKEKAKLTKTGDALIFLGSIIYGSGIFLVGQMFHIRANWPEGLILWMIGTVVMALASNESYLFNFGALLGFVVLFSEPYYIFPQMTGLTVGNTTLPLLMLACALTFYVGYIIRKKVLEEFKEYY